MCCSIDFIAAVAGYVMCLCVFCVGVAQWQSACLLCARSWAQSLMRHTKDFECCTQCFPGWHSALRVRLKASGESQGKDWRPPYLRVVVIERGAFGSPPTAVDKLTYLCVCLHLLLQLLDNACVSLFEEDKLHREETIVETNSIYDMICVALARRKQYGLFLEVSCQKCFYLQMLIVDLLPYVFFR